ncbi:hypothetical protein [Thermococcus piezophilus]|nr:hypothetical protein [Thermococcus piezophilus]
MNPPIFIGYIDPKAEIVAIIVDDLDAPRGNFYPLEGLEHFTARGDT